MHAQGFLALEIRADIANSNSNDDNKDSNDDNKDSNNEALPYNLTLEALLQLLVYYLGF